MLEFTDIQSILLSRVPAHDRALRRVSVTARLCRRAGLGQAKRSAREGAVGC